MCTKNSAAPKNDSANVRNNNRNLETRASMFQNAKVTTRTTRY